MQIIIEKIQVMVSWLPTTPRIDFWSFVANRPEEPEEVPATIPT
jgi:hypothetical protein